ncbi:AAA family ATPase [Streptantibioticus ferralitis]|uniref:AAA family ATPase n=1 Tax=Streptantibioticus ferralitis TaxID=236510 RepID=A0ABT5Z491_9ACTN|nr:AAA family ATPase [Streptantibioticus ferralitis]MDF2258583.1 AAA family ATPase [Streptantibioticus ferralitis]
MKIPSLLDLDIEQQAVISLPFHGSHVITGEPGAGKTVMAVYRAWALATAGRQVVLLTYSNLLHQYLAQMAPDLTEALNVTTYHLWIKDFWRRHFRTDPPWIDEDGWIYDWSEMQRDCVLQRVGATMHLVIDEGQTLPVAFYQLCRILGVDVTVCADENQQIDDDQSTVSEICQALGIRGDPLVLHENRRNSREIAMLASEFRETAGSEIPLPTRLGCTPTVLKVPSLGYLLTGVSQYFNAHPGRSIGIICRSTRLMRDIQSELTRLGLAQHTQAYVHGDRYRDAVDFSTRPIRIVSAASMKGLEFDTVFVPDLDAYTEDPTSVDARLRFYVLCTRAREDLHFAHRGPQEPAILSSIPESLLVRHAG